MAATVNLTTFDITQVAKGESCENDGWGFELVDSKSQKFTAIDLNSATGVASIGPIGGNVDVYFVDLPVGKSLTDLSSSGSTAGVSYDSAFSAPAFVL
ncbi:MAG: hypothetical protein ACO3D0_09515, partial [Ilumatobacteraceae bacterium]